MSTAPVIEFDPALPIAAHAAEIAELIAANQVVIIAGETGSGKTTQLPKICLQLGRKAIAHTQPRRIAARTVASRIADELGVELGDLVGYQVRFTKQAGRNTQLKVMTDGVLLAELGRDKDLRAYDTIIIDEAHERSLNIDFLLGYLKQLLPARPDLKVIVTSATIDTARFAEHFGGAPIIEVSGRTYPVETRYRPLGELDQVAGIVDAVTELVTESGDGDILVFLSGEREIRDAADALAGAQLGLDVKPLYARLATGEQQAIFAAHNRRRVVLATNVAETSITVPGIRYVVDAGTARISRYSARTKVQRLPIEAISQASANQRAGRCGRLGPGICIRLYSQEDFESRPEFTEPEILRTNLAMVILQMAQAGLGDIRAFPFVEAPVSAQLADGLRLLDELGALVSGRSGDVRLTKTGRQLAQLPVDPRLGRMLVAGAEFGCLPEVLVVVSGLAIPDVRERPAEHAAKADELHRRFWADQPETQPIGEQLPLRHTAHTGTRPAKQEQKSDPMGDIGALLRLWDYLRSQRRALSGNAFRRMCREEYLNYLRTREWEDLHTQLRQACRDLKLDQRTGPEASGDVLAAVLSGLLSHVGLADISAKEQPGRRKAIREYLGARGARFAIQPGSALAKRTPPLVMAVELVETSRLWARTVAQITPEQVERVGGHLLKSSLSEPHFSPRSGRVEANERLTLLGVPIVGSRKVDFGGREPAVAREIFIRSGLVEGLWRTNHAFFAANQALRAEAESLADRTRSHGSLADDSVIYEFYAARIGQQVVSAATFDRWWRRVGDKSVLNLSMDQLLVEDVAAHRFPDTWEVGNARLAVSYVFEPGQGHDGVHIQVPLAKLNQLNPAVFSWQVPGLRHELATELIRTLPKATRRNFVPAPQFADQALSWLSQHPSAELESLSEGLSRALRAITGEVVPVELWRPDAVPAHLQPTFNITDGERVVKSGHDLGQLRVDLTAKLNQRLTQRSAKSITGATSWVFGKIPRRSEFGRGGNKAVGFPALTDEGATVGLALVDTPEKANRLHFAGVRRLLTCTNPDTTRWVVTHLSNADKLALGHSEYPSVPDLLADARLKAVGQLAHRFGADVHDEAAYRVLADQVRTDTADQHLAVTRSAAGALASHARIRTSLSDPGTAAGLRSDVDEQLSNLMFNKFISATPDPWFDRLGVYLAGIESRLISARLNPSRDALLQSVVDELEGEYAELVGRQPPGALSPEVEEIAFLLEEFRISQFAQQLRTVVPVSAKRIRKAIADA